MNALFGEAPKVVPIEVSRASMSLEKEARPAS